MVGEGRGGGRRNHPAVWGDVADDCLCEVVDNGNFDAVRPGRWQAKDFRLSLGCKEDEHEWQRWAIERQGPLTCPAPRAASWRGCPSSTSGQQPTRTGPPRYASIRSSLFSAMGGGMGVRKGEGLKYKGPAKPAPVDVHPHIIRAGMNAKGMVGSFFLHT